MSFTAIKCGPLSQLDDTDDPMDRMETLSGQTAEALKATKERMRRMCNQKELLEKGRVIKELQVPTIPKCAEVSQSRLGEMGGQTTIYVYKKYDASQPVRPQAARRHAGACGR